MRVVAGAVRRDGRLLVAQRAPPRREAFLWELPGGKVEPGEAESEALVRELAEELGVQVRALAHLGVATHAYDHAIIELSAWGAELLSGEPEAREHLAIRWLSADELEAVEWAPADIPLLGAVRGWLGGDPTSPPKVHG